MSRGKTATWSERYCVAKNLEAATEKEFNGKVCLVVHCDERDTSRVGVLFVDQLAFYRGQKSALISLRIENLEPVFGVCVRDSPLGGKGLFTTKAFSKGEIIFEEKPFIIAPNLRAVPAFVENYLSDVERAALAVLTMADLSLLPRPLGDNEWVRRFANNCITCEANSDNLPAEVAAGMRGQGAIQAMMALYPVMCRANHSCFLSDGNNARWAWDKARGVQYLTAARDLTEGSEITVDYISDAVFGEGRVENLAVHGIVGCACAACRPHSTRVGGGATVARRFDQYETIKHKLTVDAATVEKAARRKAKAAGAGEGTLAAASAYVALGSDGTSILDEIESACGVVGALANLKSLLLLNVFQNLILLKKGARGDEENAIVEKLRTTAANARELRLAVVGLLSVWSPVHVGCATDGDRCGGV